MAESKRVSTFGPDTARRIKNYVDRNAPVTEPPTNQINGKLNSQTSTMAKVTGSATISSVVQHSWTEVRWNITTLEWDDVPEGRSGTTTVNFLINTANAGTEIATNTIVEIRKCEDPTTRKQFWVGGSSASLPTGQYQYMAYVMTSNNQAGFDFIRLHPPV